MDAVTELGSTTIGGIEQRTLLNLQRDRVLARLADKMADAAVRTEADASAGGPSSDVELVGPAETSDATRGSNFSSDDSKDARLGANPDAEAKTSSLTNAADLGALSDEERRLVVELKARDREVRAHERRHTVVGGPYASNPNYTYQIGPDGKRYAIGGEVKIDVSPVADDPAATIAKMEIVRAAALAPAEPSPADRRVAAVADSVRTQALADFTALRAAERRGEEVNVLV